MSQEHEFSRTEMLIGKDALDKLAQSRVAVFGVGGVGSFAVEAIARCGVGNIALFDHDTVNITNINRQLIALHSSLGQKKVEVMKKRILDINPDCRVDAFDFFYSADTADDIQLSEYDYIVDAIDTVTSKLLLIERAAGAKVCIISSMGAGNKLNPAGFEVADIYKTSVCPLAKVMRKELRARGIAALKVVFSREEVIKPETEEDESCTKDIGVKDSGCDTKVRRHIPGSISFVPSAAGLVIASEVIKDIIGL